MQTSDIDPDDRESGTEFLPKFDSNGLMSAVVQDDHTGEILMVAFMDTDALAATRESGFAHFYSRSRKTLWKKGETSGNVIEVNQLLVDCDQDAIVIKGRPAGPTCHTGAESCFYRELGTDGLKRLPE